MLTSHYIIALGSNQRHARHGTPDRVIAAVLDALPVVRASRTIHSRPLGPSQRTYANAAAIIETILSPPDLLMWLKSIERDFGRRGGKRWGTRVLDLDIILWSGGIWSSKGLGIPHAEFRCRSFVLTPSLQIAPQWRDPLTNLNINHLKARLDRNRPRP